MCQDETKEKLKCDKLLLKLHLKYILGIAFACVCLIIILSFGEDSTFKNCISVSSTVTSIILSVIAIILSVTGERTTNEIRNKVSDSVNQLEDCTHQSSELTEELTKMIQQMNTLYENVNENIVNQIPEIKSTLNDLLQQNKENVDGLKLEEDNAIDHIVRFLNNINPKTKEYVKKAYMYFTIEGREHPIEMGDIMLHLINEGADVNTSNLVIGLMLGNLCTGTLTRNNEINELINRL